MTHACEQARNSVYRRALPTLRYLAGCLVRVRQTVLVSGLCLLLGNSAMASVDTRSIRTGANPQQSTWHLGEQTDGQSWYWGEVPKIPKVLGGRVICAPITGGQRCVLVAQGKYRYLMADGVIVEDSRYRLRLLQVWR